MSWNNKEEIETTCTVQQWRSIHITKTPILYKTHTYTHTHTHTATHYKTI